ncbi:MAG: wax ester/triacylglycerol synthase domain-containing protein [Acidimicrobiales bacterium]
MERLTPEDAAFLRMENEISAMHSVSLAVFEPDEPPFDDIVARVERSITQVPRLRQRVMEVPFDIGRPVWIEDPGFALDYHVRHTGLPEGSGDLAIANLAGRILSQRLDRGKPLWEVWVVSGLPDKRWAVLSKSHHAIVDGVSGTDPLAVIMDQSQKDRRHKDRWEPDPLPSPIRLTADAMVGLAVNPVERYRLARQAVVRPRRVLRGLQSVITPEPAAKALLGRIGTHRRWRGVDVDRHTIDEISAATGAPTGAVVLALICAGFRAVLEHTAEAPDRIEVLLPLASTTGSMAAPTARRISLPVGEPDAFTRLSIIAAAIGVTGWSHVHPTGFTTPTVAALGARTLTRRGMQEPEAHTVSVLAGLPEAPQSLLDRPMIATFPVLPLASRVRVATGAYIGTDHAWFGVTGAFEAADEVDRLCAGLQSGLEELR